MDRIDLATTIDALRDELAKSAIRAESEQIDFGIAEIELEFHVGVTKEGEGKAGVKFWVAELGVGGSYVHETIQTVRIKLNDVRRNNRPARIGEDAAEAPE
ncbi:trypco2 family protein [Kribbella sp. NPDC003505]|uniref:trypco2 family protein n=1 Tax=Kribbella sp. NPDC003505 TaxID=3154448 RepID=UPI0033BA985A